MGHQLQYTSLPSTRPELFIARTRRCLRCEEMFDSAWIGERICPVCKASEFHEAMVS